MFTLAVQEGQTTIKLAACGYSNAGATATIYVNGESQLQTVNLKTDEQNDGQESSIQYTSETNATITIAITGNGYLHYIKAETITPPEVATVSRNCYSPVSGSMHSGSAVAGADAAVYR